MPTGASAEEAPVVSEDPVARASAIDRGQGHRAANESCAPPSRERLADARQRDGPDWHNHREADRDAFEQKLNAHARGYLPTELAIARAERQALCISIPVNEPSFTECLLPSKMGSPQDRISSINGRPQAEGVTARSRLAWRADSIARARRWSPLPPRLDQQSGLRQSDIHEALRSLFPV